MDVLKMMSRQLTIKASPNSFFVNIPAPGQFDYTAADPLGIG